jgi:U3 small nucleolar RNA-associated protein MPP10
MASIREQIVQLESENVSPKEWVLMGEAGSRQRPQNSLLEEDLEFERVRKAAPVVTEDVVQNLEERIKARILQGQFDDVIRIKPIEESPFLSSRLIELRDTKSKESLAQIYEAEYVASQAGGQLPDDRDGRLKKEHDEITLLWDKICSKLDALCNAHFVPKQVRVMVIH